MHFFIIDRIDTNLALQLTLARTVTRGLPPVWIHDFNAGNEVSILVTCNVRQIYIRCMPLKSALSKVTFEVGWLMVDG